MSVLAPRVLIVDDDGQIHRFLKPALREAGFEPERADCGEEGLRLILEGHIDAVILDLGLPDLDGKEVLRRAREKYAGPIVILSARDRENEKIEALDLGADDYVEKPFGVGELLARLRVVLRRAASTPDGQSKIIAGDLEIDLALRRVRRRGEVVRLSKKEYELLARLAEGGGRVVTHRQLLLSVWGPAHTADIQYLRVFMGHLRNKIEEDPSDPKILTTELGVGYRFNSG